MTTTRVTEDQRSGGNGNGAPVPLSVTFTVSEKERIEDFAAQLHAPRTFVLVLQIANLMAQSPDPMAAWVSTQQVFPCVADHGRGFESEILKTLVEAFELGILHRKEPEEGAHRSSAMWRVSEDGKRFLFNGILAREKMRKISRLSDAQICDQIEQDEINEWRQDALDRGQVLAEVVAEDETLFRKRESDGGTITRAQFARTIAAKNIKRTKDAQSEISPLWADLLR